MKPQKPFQGYPTNEEEFPVLEKEDFGGPHPVANDYYHDQNHQDSICIFCWVIIASIGLALVFLVVHLLAK